MANVVDVHLKLVTTPQQIAVKINDAIRNHIQLVFLKINTISLRTKIGKIIRDAVLDSPEVKSLKGGQLQGELGPTIANVSDALDLIIDSLVNTMVITFMPLRGNVTQRLRGGLRLQIFPKTLVATLSKSKEGAFMTRKGVNIPWLKWLLNLGDKIIVRQFDVDFNHTRGSRTGLAVMKNAKRGWRVPPQFSGTPSDNFLTRALEDREVEIVDLFVNEFKKKI